MATIEGDVASQSRLGDDRSEFQERNFIPAANVPATSCECGRTGNCQNLILVICEEVFLYWVKKS